jgi:hypothetical protein
MGVNIRWRCYCIIVGLDNEISCEYILKSASKGVNNLYIRGS